MEYRWLWELQNTPLFFIEATALGDKEIMQQVMGLRLIPSYFLVDKQNANSYLSVDTIKKIEKRGAVKYANPKFIGKYYKETILLEKKIIRIISRIKRIKLENCSNQELFSFYDQIFAIYSTYLGYYRMTRPEFTVFLVNQLQSFIIKNVPADLRERVLSQVLNNQIRKTRILFPGKLRVISTNLYRIGKRRFNMHAVWIRTMTDTKRLFNEIGKRIGLTTIETQNCLHIELEKALLYNVAIKNIIINQRLIFYRAVNTAKNFFIETQKTQIIRSREKEIKGLCAQPGKVKGVVYIIKQSVNQPLTNQMAGMKKGQILVTGNTSPDMMPVIKKAAGIITDEGGLLSHAAIVSREFKIPCIVGTKNATLVLKNGDRVELDATKGIAKKII